MIKILLISLLWLGVNLSVMAQPVEASSEEYKRGITFIYLNGSNNNTEPMKDWFLNGVKKLHPVLMKQFESNYVTKSHFLNNGQFAINKEPVIFFWGDKSREGLEKINEDLDMMKMVSPKFAQMVRSFMAHCLHDAIWVQKFHNMHPLVKNLHEQIMQEYARGNQTVLYGYSAGSFITFQYLVMKLPYINPVEMFQILDISQDEKDYIKSTGAQNTCIDAIVDAKLAVFSMDRHLVPNINSDLLKSNFKKLNEQTKLSCTPPGALKGIVNFASPLVLFYSDLSGEDFELTYYNKLMYKYLIENDMFWLTVNFKEDPLGFPTTRNLTSKEIEKIANIDIEPHKGFVYDKSDVGSNRTFISAHLAYWSNVKKLSKAIVNAYDEGYNLYYFQDELAPILY